MVGHLARARQFGMRTSESLPFEVPNAIQVQVLQGLLPSVGVPADYGSHSDSLNFAVGDR